MNPVWTIYCHTLISDGRRYVGITKKTMLHRWNQHVAQSRSSKGGRWHFPNAIRKYGKDAFSHEVLQVCNTLEEGNEAEKYWIREYDTRNLEKGFNLAEGGEHTPHPIKNPWDDPEYRIKSTLAAKRRWEDPSIRARNLASTKLALNTPESKLKRAASSSAVWTRDGYREKASQVARVAASKPSNIVRRSEASKKLWEDSTYRCKLMKVARNRALSPAFMCQQSEEARLRSVTGHQRYVMSDGVITHKLCRKHGLLPIDECYVGFFRSGSPRIQCKRCILRKSSGDGI